MTPHPTILFFVLGILIALAALWRAVRIPAHHSWRRQQARTMSGQLRGRDRDQPFQLIYGRLRAMDPLAFEELLLESLESRGLRVIRNRRYTGDGGIDGRVIIDGETVLIQAKRYASSIRPEHVAAFATLCRTRRCRGLFIHTGRTGPQSRQLIIDNTNITIVSGSELIALLRGDLVTCLTRTVARAPAKASFGQQQERRG